MIIERRDPTFTSVFFRALLSGRKFLRQFGPKFAKIAIFWNTKCFFPPFSGRFFPQNFQLQDKKCKTSKWTSKSQFLKELYVSVYKIRSDNHNLYLQCIFLLDSLDDSLLDFLRSRLYTKWHLSARSNRTDIFQMANYLFEKFQRI